MEKEFRLRSWEKEDLGSLVKYADNLNIARNMTDRFPHPYSEKDGIGFIEFAMAADSAHIFAIEVDGEAAGGIGIHLQDDIHRRNAELGYWLGEPFWGMGIISRAIWQAVDFAFRNYEGIERIFARPFGSNTASQKVLEKNGFIPEARFAKTLIKNGELEDELVYAVRRENFYQD
ncbi:GNAT family N-acetyltransferase [Chryseobacterium hagamense]|uniref:N-acetyltransferase n=1 Tax=Chryseobacterium hagamense TaxID=395935 RepID=A0A511YLG7_9FLAO|nr:GNAT family protein [Chryseobacterium hagamense]GEN76039.1 N-acetyltransferase [Chryseobacterium hagamense]